MLVGVGTGAILSRRTGGDYLTVAFAFGLAS